MCVLPINIRRQSRLTTTTTYRLRSIYEWSGLPRLPLSFALMCIAIYSRRVAARRIACRLGVLGVFHLEFTSSR